MEERASLFNLGVFLFGLNLRTILRSRRKQRRKRKIFSLQNGIAIVNLYNWYSLLPWTICD